MPPRRTDSPPRADSLPHKNLAPTYARIQTVSLVDCLRTHFCVAHPKLPATLRPGAEFDDNWVSHCSPMCPDSDLSALMLRYQQGDFDAAAALIHSLSPRLHRFFSVESAGRSDADDLLQETWLRIHEARHTYRPGEPVLPWFFAIARHIRVDHYRKVKRRSVREESLDEMPQVPGAPPAAPAGGPDLEELLAPLPASQREVIEMLKIAGMSLEEVARATSSSVGSVKQKAHRAYEKLRDRLSAMGPKGPGGIS